MSNPQGVITFGGAFSNHIHATAGAGSYLDIHTVGIIRGEYDEENPTLIDARSFGMKLHFVSREEYKKKEASVVVQKIMASYAGYTLVPEGGSNALAIKGVHELGQDIDTIACDVVALAAGTGATARGMIAAIDDREMLIFSALKGPDLYDEFGINPQPRHRIIDRYNCGGYGRTNAELITCMNQFYEDTGIPTDPVYNGKVIYGLLDMIASGRYDGKKILWIHSGGLQGVEAHNYMCRKKGRLDRILYQ